MKWVCNAMKDQVEEFKLMSDKYSSSGNSVMFKTFADYETWRNRFVEGLPQATELYSVEELVKMGLVGLYELDDKKE